MKALCCTVDLKRGCVSTSRNIPVCTVLINSVAETGDSRKSIHRKTYFHNFRARRHAIRRKGFSSETLKQFARIGPSKLDRKSPSVSRNIRGWRTLESKETSFSVDSVLFSQKQPIFELKFAVLRAELLK